MHGVCLVKSRMVNPFRRQKQEDEDPSLGRLFAIALRSVDPFCPLRLHYCESNTFNEAAFEQEPCTS